MKKIAKELKNGFFHVNVLYGNLNSQKSEVVQAAQKAAIDKFFKNDHKKS